MHPIIYLYQTMSVEEITKLIRRCPDDKVFSGYLNNTPINAEDRDMLDYDHDVFLALAALTNDKDAIIKAFNGLSDILVCGVIV